MPLDITRSDFEERVVDPRTGIMIVPSRDSLIDQFQITLLRKYYLRRNETPQEGYARAASFSSGGDLALAQRLYDSASKGWFMWSSPILSNAILPGERSAAMPISCFLLFADDTLKSIIEIMAEISWLAVRGGGTGVDFSKLRSVSEKSPGPIPFMHAVDAQMDAFRQGGTRKGSNATYMNVDHPDIIEFINSRTPTGDQSRKLHSSGSHIAVNIPDWFMEAVLLDLYIDLKDPNDRSVRGRMRARDIWQAVLTTRYRTGEPYLFFIDHANDVLPETQKQLGLRINNSNLCSEITLPTNNERTAVCCLSSLNAEKYDDWKGTPLVADLITMLDNVLDYFIEYAQPELHKAVRSASLERSVGLGMMGFHSYLQSKMIPFESMAARNINDEMFRSVKSEAVKQSYRLGAERGEAPDMRGTGRRNAALLAVAPNANSAIILGTSPSIEPANANAYTHQTRAGSWPVKSRHLQSLLRSKGKDTDEVWQNIITSKGSVQHLDFLTPHEKAVFKTAIELDQMWIVQLAADRQKYICQSQSLNLFFPPNVDKAYFNRVHVAAWRKGLKSLYYTRTMTPHVVKSVSEKIVRVALKDGVDATLITPKSVEELEEALSEGDCVSCQG